MTVDDAPGLIDQYRVLDLTDAKGQLAGKILADMGASVIKVEPPIGDSARNIPPFYQDDPASEKSLYWWAYNTSKRGITLDLETADGRDVFLKLVAKSDVVLESFTPGYLAGIGLGYDDLVEAKEDIILVSLTPFGQTGPYAQYKATDFINIAMSGNMYLTGDADRPPVACQMATTHYHSCAETANATLSALWFREVNGEGQHVDVSIHNAMQTVPLSGPSGFVLSGTKSRRSGARYTVNTPSGLTLQREVWPCKDGFVSFGLRGGPARIPPFQRLLQWMNEEGARCDFLKGIDWPNYDNNKLTQEEVDKMVEELTAFFMTKTSMELYEAAIEKGYMIAAVYNAASQLADKQLQDRDFFVPLEHPELKTSLTYPGSFVKSKDAFIGVRSRAPLIGEHNIEIFEGELGLRRDQLLTLKEAGII